MALIQKKIENRKQRGYTIIEVMIVLSVSSVIFIAAIAGYARQNSKTEFTNGVRDMENKIQDILNDVNTGYYPNFGNFSCTRTGSSPAHIFIDTDAVSAAEQGTNQDCIFLGKAVYVDDGNMAAFTIVGLRNSKDDADELSAGVEDTANRIVPPYIGGATNTLDLNASIHIEKIVVSPAPPAFSSGFAVVSGFGNGDLGGAGATTSQVQIGSISTSYDFNNGTNPVVTDDDLNKDITICIRESGNDPGEGRQASITIGSGAQRDIETVIDGWATECN